MNSSIVRTLIAAVIVVGAVVFGVFEFVTEPSARVFVPAIAGIVACSSAVLVWDFFGLSRKVFLFFIFLAGLYASVPFIRLCIGSELRPSEFLVSIEAACASFVPLLFLWYLSGQARNYVVRGIARALAIIVAVGLVLFPGSVWAYFIAMRQLLTSDIILAMAQTNGDESLEYVQAHGNVWWIAAFIFTLILVVFYLMLLARSGVNRTKHFRGRFTAGIFLFVVSIYDLVNVVPEVPYIATSVLKVTGIQLREFENYSRRAKERESMLAALPEIITDDKHSGIYVLVLGESENRDHMQVYGYGRETTPYMNSLIDDKNSIFFEKPFSSFPQTVPALTYALSGKNQYNGLSLTDSFSLIDIARKAGFDVWWISNQRKFGVYETPITVISSSASHEIWLNNTAKMYSLFYDEDLVDRIPSFDPMPNKNILVIIHLMGSHERYNERTPDEAKVFHGSKDKRIDWYDDTILYTDNNLKKICEKFKGNASFRALVYISDHGEDVDEQFDHNPAKFTFPMVRIPLMVWLSDSYLKDNPDTARTLANNRSRVWTNDLTYDLMCGLMGFSKAPHYERKFDLSSRFYSLSEKTAVTMHGDFLVTEDPEYPQLTQDKKQ
ncbi:MAG: sulfatase-like hydrolase/transferase [Succinatimonas hippei]|nr:sulfatase-like hydrolase/transferase [Succinatimonas hippei]